MRLADKVATMARRGAPLPYDAEVEWLYIAPNQYIKTNVASGDIKKLFLDIEVTKVKTAYGFAGFGIMTGVVNGGNNARRCVELKMVDNVYYTAINDRLENPRVELRTNKRFSVDVDFINSLAVIDGTTVDISSSDYLPTYMMLIGAGSRSIDGTPKDVAQSGEARWYGVKFYDAELNLVLDFKPVRIGSGDNAVGYMYDSVTKKLFGNDGTGAFVIGPDVVSSKGGVLNA